MKYTSILFLLFASFALAAEEPVKTDSNEAAQTRDFNVTLAIQKNGDYQTAVERWDSYLNNYPDSANAMLARYNRGICNYQISKYDLAKQDLEAVLKVEKKSDKQENALFYLAMSYRELGINDSSMLSSAKTRFEMLLKEYPNTGFYSFAALGLGEVYNMLGDSNQALTMFQNVYTRYPLTKQGAYAYLEAGKILYSQNADVKCANLMIEFENKQKTSPLRLEAAILAGNALFRAKYYTHAERQYAIASNEKTPGIENFSQADYALYNRGVCYFSLKEYDKAVTVFSELVKRFPKSQFIPTTELSMAEALQLLNKVNECKEHYLKAASFPQTASSANLNLAKVYFKENDLKNAMDKVNQLPATMFKAFKGMPVEQLDIVRSACQLRAQIYGHSTDIENQKSAVKFCDEIIAILEKEPVALWATLFSAQLQHDLKNYSDCIERCTNFQKSWPKSKEILEAQVLVADCLLKTQQYKESGQQFYNLFKNYPSNARRYEWLVSAAMSLDKLDKPQNVLKILVPEIKNIVTPTLRADALYCLGKAYLESNDIPNAKAMILQCQKESPKYPNMDWVLYVLGQVYRAENDVPNAIATFQKILDDYPHSSIESKATLELSQLKSLSGDIDNSLESFDKIIAQSKDNSYRPQAIIESAVVLYQNKRIDKVVERTTLFINDYPDNEMVIKAYYLRSMSKIQQQKYDEALKDCQQALTIAQQKNLLDQWEIKLRSALMNCLAQSKDTVEQTIAEFDKLQTAKKRLNTTIPDEDTILFLYANTLFNAKKLDNGKSSYETIFTQFPKSKHHFNCALMLGEIAKENNNIDVAKNYLTQAVAGTDSVSAIKAAKNLGFIYLDAKDYPSAYQNFDKTIQIYESNVQLQSDTTLTPVVQEARFQKAETLFCQKKYTQALTLYQELTDIPEANQALGYFHASQCASTTGKLDIAMEFINKGLDENNNLKAELAKTSKQLEPALQGQRALLYFKTGNGDKSIVLFKRIVKENANLDTQQADKTALRAVANSWFHLGEYQMQINKKRDAITLFYNVIYGYPFPDLQADACYEAARCFEDLEQTSNAEKMYKTLLEICPNSSKAEFAKSKLNKK